MVFGIPAYERIQLNEDSLWPGGPDDWGLAEGTRTDLDQIREYLKNGDHPKADSLLVLKFSRKGVTRSHQTLGDLWFDFEWDEVTKYKRSLDLDEAITYTTFKSEGHEVTQEVFASAPDQAILIKLHTTHPNGFRGLIRLDRPMDQNFPTTETKPLNDNLLERTDPAEVAAVMGHEMGHYVLGHSWRTVLILALIVAIGLFIVARLEPQLIERHGAKWGIGSIADPAAIPLLSLILTVYFLAATPATNSLVRINESEADRFGLDTAKEPDGFAKVAMRLSEYRKIEPGPVEEMLFFDHPSGATRVRMSMQWKADHVENPVMVNPGKLEKE